MKHLRKVNLLTSAIGLPSDDGAGLRIGTNETVRWGMTTQHMAELGSMVARAIEHREPESMAEEVTEFRKRFSKIGYIQQKLDRSSGGGFDRSSNQTLHENLDSGGSASDHPSKSFTRRPLALPRLDR